MAVGKMRACRRAMHTCFIIFVQCWTNVEDVGLTLYKCYTNVMCLVGMDLIINSG